MLGQESVPSRDLAFPLSTCPQEVQLSVPQAMPRGKSGGSVVSAVTAVSRQPVIPTKEGLKPQSSPGCHRPAPWALPALTMSLAVLHILAPSAGAHGRPWPLEVLMAECDLSWRPPSPIQAGKCRARGTCVLSGNVGRNWFCCVHPPRNPQEGLRWKFLRYRSTNTCC